MTAPLRPSLPLAALVGLLASVSTALAQTPIGTNLLANPGFENGLTGWTTVQSSVQVVLYGQPGYATPAVSQKVGGGAWMLADLGNDGIVQQAVALTALPPDAHLVAGGFFGGGGVDRSRLEVRFLDGGGNTLPGTTQLEWVTPTDRNQETVLKRRERAIAIPPGAAQALIRVELEDVCCSGTLAAADEVYARIELGSVLPPPFPFGVELLENGSFEELGWTSTSPLTLESVGGWEGAGPSPVEVVTYSGLGGLDTTVSCIIDGGPAGLSCQVGGAGRYVANLGESALRQRVDLRGNTPQFSPSGSVRLSVSGYLGGDGDAPDEASVKVTFRDEFLAAITETPLLGPVTEATRNQETVLLARTDSVAIPAGTAYVDIEVVLDYTCCQGFTAYADLIGARLVQPSAAEPAIYGVNLIGNASFETGSLPGSPLVLTDADGWEGTALEYTGVQLYGSSSTVPSTAFASANGLGGSLLRDVTGDGALRQTIDVAGNAARIDLGQVQGYVSAWLGGHSTDLDSAKVVVTCLGQLGTPIGPTTTIGPVTAADRLNQTTLLPRDATFAVPPGTRSVRLDLLFDEVCCSGSNATADDVRLVLSTTDTGLPVLLPGSGEDLRLFTGIDGPPTSGPGEEVELATENDVLTVAVLSPEGTYDFGPLMLGATVYATAAGPQYPLLLPDVLLDTSNVVLLLNGLFCSGFGCDVVLPGGTQGNWLIPAGMGGLTIRLQALAFAPPGSGVVPANGAYASTEAHEVIVQ